MLRVDKEAVKWTPLYRSLSKQTPAQSHLSTLSEDNKSKNKAGLSHTWREVSEEGVRNDDHANYKAPPGAALINSFGDEAEQGSV